MRTVYIFDKTSGDYLRSQTIPDRIYEGERCVWDGLNDNMTEVAPPECPAGSHLHWTGNGWETVVDPVPETPKVQTDEERWESLSPEEKARELRDRRDSMIEEVIWRVQRYDQQTRLGIATTDSADQYHAVLAYIEALREVPEQGGFPEKVVWPVLAA